MHIMSINADVPYLRVRVVGLQTWPPQPPHSPAAAATRGDVLIRMAMASATVVAMSAVQQHVGSTLVGALASLPTILMIMSPAVHAAQGPAHAVSLTQGTLTSTSGTAAYVCAVAVLTPTLGILISAGIGLAALPVANAIVKRLGTQDTTPPRGRAGDVIRPVMSR